MGMSWALFVHPNPATDKAAVLRCGPQEKEGFAVSDLRARVAYLQGLVEGMELTTGSREGRIISEIIDVMAEFADAISDLSENQSDMEDYVEDLDSDLTDLEEHLLEDDGDSDSEDAGEVLFQWEGEPIPASGDAEQPEGHPGL